MPSNLESLEVKIDKSTLPINDETDALGGLEDFQKDFWWVISDVETGTRRWPFTCLLCSCKLSKNYNQLCSHSSTRDHKMNVLACDDFTKLEPLLSREVKKLADHLGVIGRNIFIVNEKQTKVNMTRMCKAIKNAKHFNVSFMSYEGKIIELTVLGEGFCICIERSCFNGKGNISIKKFIRFLKLIFEKANAVKVGKDLLVFDDFAVQ